MLAGSQDGNASSADTFDPDDCPYYSLADIDLLDRVSFWIEGVLLVAVACFGVVGNAVASVIVSRREMRNSFNLLLVSMAVFDSTYLAGSVLESVRKTFDAASDAHVALFPHVLYPLNQVRQHAVLGRRRRRRTSRLAGYKELTSLDALE